MRINLYFFVTSMQPLY